MDVTCAACGTRFEAQRATRKYCSDRCRTHAAEVRKTGGEVVQFPVPAPTSEADRAESRTPIADSLRSTFATDDLTSPAGVTALRLATDVDRSSALQPGYSSLVAQMRAAVEDLRAQSKPRAATPLTLLRDRRDADRASSTA